MSLLEEAKKIKIKPRNREISLDQIELAIAWLKDEVTISQVSKVLPESYKKALIKYEEERKK